MPLGIINLEWLNLNAQRAYPLTAEATKVDQTGTIAIPDSFIVELCLPVHAGLNVEPDKFFLYSLGIFPTGYNIVFAYDDGTNDPPLVANVNISKDAHTENRSYALTGSGDYADSVGTITIGRLEEMETLSPGLFYFTPAGGQIEPDAIRPFLRGVSSITVVNGTDVSEPIYGDITLVAGTNIRLVVNQVLGSDPEIVISAISGEGLNEDCVCDDAEEGPCIKTINGVAPEPGGNFVLSGQSCLQLSPITNGLQITDSCATPCCGCTELDAIRDQLNLFADARMSLEGIANRLDAEVSAMQAVVLGSRLNDQGCLTC